MKTDLRILKSKKAIEESFIQLVEIKGFANITMKEIAEKAVVNRNTIYLNYGSKEGILLAIIKNGFIKHFGDISLDQYKKIGINRRKITNTFNKLFDALNENIELYRILLLDKAAMGYIETEAFKLRKHIFNLFKNTPKSVTIMDFYIGGLWGILRSYIIYASATQEEATKILTDLTIVNMRQLQIQK